MHAQRPARFALQDTAWVPIVEHGVVVNQRKVTVAGFQGTSILVAFMDGKTTLFDRSAVSHQRVPDFPYTPER